MQPDKHGKRDAARHARLKVAAGARGQPGLFHALRRERLLARHGRPGGRGAAALRFRRQEAVGAGAGRIAEGDAARGRQGLAGFWRPHSRVRPGRLQGGDRAGRRIPGYRGGQKGRRAAHKAGGRRAPRRAHRGRGGLPDRERRPGLRRGQRFSLPRRGGRALHHQRLGQGEAAHRLRGLQDGVFRHVRREFAGRQEVYVYDAERRGAAPARHAVRAAGQDGAEGRRVQRLRGEGVGRAVQRAGPGL